MPPRSVLRCSRTCQRGEALRTDGGGSESCGLAEVEHGRTPRCHGAAGPACNEVPGRTTTYVPHFTPARITRTVRSGAARDWAPHGLDRRSAAGAVAAHADGPAPD